MPRKTLLSVIIPAHNAEKTIGNLIASFGFEDSDPVEILVVENGSSDRTEEIVKEVAEKKSFVQLLHSEKGVSYARNAGLDAARGDWIVFADADDSMTASARKILAHDIKSGEYDFVLYGHEVGDMVKSVSQNGENHYQGEQACISALVRMLENPTLYMPVWAKLFSAEIIRKHQLRFNTDMRFSEDSDFTLRYCLHCHSVLFSDKVLYHYSLNPDSVMRTQSSDKTEQYLSAMRMTSEALQDAPTDVQNAFMIYILMHFNIAMVREVFATSSPADWKSRIQTMKQFSQEDVFRKAFAGVPLGKCRNMRMIPVLLMKLHCYQLAGLTFRTRARMNDRRERKN